MYLAGKYIKFNSLLQQAKKAQLILMTTNQLIAKRGVNQYFQQIVNCIFYFEKQIILCLLSVLENTGTVSNEITFTGPKPTPSNAAKRHWQWSGHYVCHKKNNTDNTL